MGPWKAGIPIDTWQIMISDDVIYTIFGVFFVELNKIVTELSLSNIIEIAQHS